MALSDADLRKIAAHQEPRVLLHHEVVKFARAIEAEVRKQDDALIQQMLEAIEAETYDIWDCYRYHPKLHDAAVAARARLGEKT